jgi:CheY-like chemotaxis protein/DNA-directed RNA polymerase specialized sigma24 family protein
MPRSAAQRTRTTAAATGDSRLPTQTNPLIGILPYLRRYARALTGSQERGDRYVRQFLEIVIQDASLLKNAGDLKLNAFAIFHKIRQGLDTDLPRGGATDAGPDPTMERRIAKLPELHREILLLVSLEGFSITQAAQIVAISADEAREKLMKARLELQREVGANVLIIEDDTVIAMDVSTIVRSAGHTVIGVADNVAGALALAAEQRPDLILADVQLKGGDSGIDAVERILKDIKTTVIFVTGFPEALLTGDRPEPTFLITKPFDPEVLTTTIGQALSVTRVH